MRRAPLLAFSLVVALVFMGRVCAVAQDDEEYRPNTLAIGAAAPDFNLPGTDGRQHRLSDFKSAKLLVIVFTCNHCPTAQLYENRIKQLASDYRDRGVMLVAIEPNNPRAIRLDELGYTDVSDSFEEMKIRSAYRHFNFPYLYDGDTQRVAQAYGPTATPHVFIFDQQRKLRYVGRIDDSMRENLVKRREARDALEALLAGRPVQVEKTASFGCSTKWMYKESSRLEAIKQLDAQPVSLDLAGGDDLKALRQNTTNKLLLVDFWATWCGPCISEFSQFVTIERMYGHRLFQVVTVSANYPDEKNGVLRFLNEQHAAKSRNLLFNSTDKYDLMAAFDAKWDGSIPHTLLVKPGGEIVYHAEGPVNVLALRRAIIANMVDDDYVGHAAYWRTGGEAQATSAGR